MKTPRFRKPTAWMLVGLIAALSLAAVACSTSSDDSPAEPVENEVTTDIGAPAGAGDSTGAVVNHQLMRHYL